jgi:hypothetical protein
MGAEGSLRGFGLAMPLPFAHVFGDVERSTPAGPTYPQPATSTFELDIAAHVGAVDHLAEQNVASVTELTDESSELVAGISHGERLSSLGHPVTREDLDTLRPQPLRQQPQRSHQRSLRLRRPRRWWRRLWWLPPNSQPARAGAI